MIRFTSVIFAIGLALLAGCAGIKQNAGYNIEATKVEQGDQGGVQPPWRCVSVRGLVSEAWSYTVAEIKLPQPRPEVWNNEIYDPSLSYKVGKSVRAIECSVWRTAFYVDGKIETFDAIMNRDKTLLYVLLPSGRVAEYNQGNWLVWFRDGKTVMTTRGTVVAVEGNVAELSNQFFATHPSPFPRYSNLRRDHSEGRKFFQWLEEHYPVPLSLGNEGGFSVPIDIVHVGALSRGEHWLDSIVTCGSVSVVPSVEGTLVNAAFSLPHNLSVAMNGCRKKGGAVKKEVVQSGLLPSSSP